MEWLWIILGVIVVIAILVGVTFWIGSSSLATSGSKVDAIWEELRGQLQARAAIVPELVETVRGYAAHEKGVFEQAATAGGASLAATTPAAAVTAETGLQAALKSLFGVAEAYPQLQASPGFLELQGRLTRAEDEIQSTRRSYNGAVRELNTKLQRFPSRLFAKRLGLAQHDFFEAPTASAVAEAPRVQF